MIPLHEFNTIAVLKGARIPIVPSFLRDRPLARIEWCNDHLIMSEVNRPDAARTELDRCDRAGFSMCALDPVQPDTARLIDRRIAEAMNWPDLYAAQLIPARVPGGEFGIAVLLMDGFHCGSFATERFTAPLAGLPATEANLPEARRRLLIALYPPEAK